MLRSDARKVIVEILEKFNGPSILAGFMGKKVNDVETISVFIEMDKVIAEVRNAEYSDDVITIFEESSDEESDDEEEDDDDDLPSMSEESEESGSDV